MRGILSQNHRQQTRAAKKLLRSTNLAVHIGSVAVAVEAMEEILVERGVLNPDELMERIKVVNHRHFAKGENLPPSED